MNAYCDTKYSGRDINLSFSFKNMIELNYLFDKNLQMVYCTPKYITRSLLYNPESNYLICNLNTKVYYKMLIFYIGVVKYILAITYESKVEM